MNTQHTDARRFFTGRAVVFAIIFIIFLGYWGFVSLNEYIYQEKQGDPVASSTPQNPDYVEVGFEGEADPARMKLDMNVWSWISASYNDGREVVPKAPERFKLTFSGNRFSATTDCNSISGEYAAKDGMISFGKMMSTEMYCEGSQETEFAQILATASSYHFTTRGQLIIGLKYDSGTATFR
ncbi:MAG: META domain-containing protein [Candidatus Pacebacteria bacterium]|nr:META domain-containing protein [Candidatus Paceibacterota bacterium]